MVQCNSSEPSFKVHIVISGTKFLKIVIIIIIMFVIIILVFILIVHLRFIIFHFQFSVNGRKQS